MNHLYYVSLGANLPAPGFGPPLATCVWAATRLMALPGVTSACRSRWFSSAPMPPADQPRFINGVVRLSGKLTPSGLLRDCQSLEAEAGRVRGALNAARTLDVDIIDMDRLVQKEPDPILPHPRAHLRAFVLLPLRDVAPDWMHPVTGEDIVSLIAALPAQDIRPCG